MKRVFALLLCIILGLALCSCQKKESYADKIAQHEKEADIARQKAAELQAEVDFLEGLRDVLKDK